MKKSNYKTKIIKIFIFSFFFLFLVNISISLAACDWATEYPAPTNREKASDDMCSGTKPDPGFGYFYFCFCDKQTIPEAPPAPDPDKPKIVIPELQIKIPDVVYTSADITCTGEGKNRTCQSNFIGKYIAGIYKYALGVIGIIAVIVMMIGGVMWIVAAGSASRITEAKAWIGASITGLILMLCSYTILSMINPKLIKFDALGIQVTEDFKPSELTSGGGEKGTPSVTKDCSSYNTDLRNAAQQYGLSCTEIKAFMLTESSCNPNAKSSAGALGLMQVMPSTARSLGFSPEDMLNPIKSIQAGAKYLNLLKSTACDGKISNGVCDASKDKKYWVAAYNGGPESNKQSSTCPNQTRWECTNNSRYQQTRDYVNRVLGNTKKLEDNGWGC